MKQTINLLPLKSKEARNWLSFRSFVGLVTIGFVGVSTIAVLLWWQADALQVALKQAQVDKIAVQNELVKNTQAIALRQAPKTLTLQLSQWQQQIQAMQQMLELSLDDSEIEAYSVVHLINSLQNSLPLNSQLEGFKIAQQGKFSAITGTTENLEQLPLLLENLRGHGLLNRQDITKISALRGTEQHSFEIQFAGQEVEL